MDKKQAVYFPSLKVDPNTYSENRYSTNPLYFDLSTPLRIPLQVTFRAEFLLSAGNVGISTAYMTYLHL